MWIIGSRIVRTWLPVIDQEFSLIVVIQAIAVCASDGAPKRIALQFVGNNGKRDFEIDSKPASAAVSILQGDTSGQRECIRAFRAGRDS